MANQRIAEVMTSSVETAQVEVSLAEVVRRMAGRRLSCLVMCEERKPVGIVTERDLLRELQRMLQEPGENRPAREVMTSPVVAVSEDVQVREAVEVIRRHGIRRVVVVDDGGDVSGVATLSDLLDAYAHELERQSRKLEDEVAERTAELQDANRVLESLAREDGLLGIGNRRAMELTLDVVQANFQRKGRPYAIALLDVDHFKPYNDTYGHLLGDETLRRIADTLKGCCRLVDGLYRYGGEEILLLLAETEPEHAQMVAERARAAVDALGIEHSGSPIGHVTLSSGVAGVEPDESWQSVIERADRVLYAAKRAGRNQVLLAPAVASSQDD